jgi:dUTP pyrophosphatase
MTDSITIDIVRLPHAEGLDLPAYATEGSAGLDLLAAIEAPVEMKPGERALIPTGLAMALPEACEAQVRPRSGLALKHGLTVLNSPGTIDADYRGEVKVILVNLGQETVRLERGMRIAQRVLARSVRATLVERPSLPPTGRSGGGFGSTGR